MDYNAGYDETSNYENDVEKTDKPIMDLFYRLIQGDAKQTLTDIQLVEILKNEFNIDVTNLHSLEKDIYLTVMKKFLKVWPEWAEFDIIVNNLKTKTMFEKKRVFEKKYTNLKKYLRPILNTTIPLAKETIQNLIEITNSEIIIEIEASRQQLNNLFLRYPSLDCDNSIINTNAEPPKTKNKIDFSLPSILNWWDVNILIFPPFAKPNSYIYKRKTKHESKYVLTNKRLLTELATAKTLDQEIKVQIHGSRDKIKSSSFIDLMTNIGQHYSEAVKDVNILFDFILIDLSLLPPMIIPTATYKRFTNKYPYVRYLYEHVDKVSMENYNKYDIQLEETIKPAYQVSLGNMQKVNELIDWSVPDNPIVLECSSCCVIFKGFDVINELKEHFVTFHQNEIECSCTNCSQNFEIDALSKNWWCHDC